MGGAQGMSAHEFEYLQWAHGLWGLTPKSAMLGKAGSAGPSCWAV